MSYVKVTFVSNQVITSVFLNTLQDAVIDNQTNIVSHAASIVTINATLTSLQSQIDSIEVSSPGAIEGLVDGGVVDNAATLRSYLGPTEDSGSIIAADGVVAHVPMSGDYLVKTMVNLDPQISPYLYARGAVTFIPDERLPGLAPGTAGTGTRVGGGGPGAMFRPVRRASGVNKQAYQGVYGGFCIDGTGVKSSGAFTCDAAGVFTSSGHKRLNGDVIFFDTDAAGTALPAPLVNGNDSDRTKSYLVTNATTNTFKVTDYLANPITTAAGSGVWSTNTCGIYIPNQDPTENFNDPDQDFNNNKNYTAGIFKDGDISNMPGHGMRVGENNGRLHLNSFRAIGNRLDGFHIESQDKVIDGHWGAGSNGGFGLYAGSGTGVYVLTGNIWGSPGKRSVTCGSVHLDDSSYWAFVANQPNDWIWFEGGSHRNAAGTFTGNMVHPHGENYSSDGVGINVKNDGDIKLQSHIAVTGYQGAQFSGNAFSRTEGVKSRFNTPGNYGGVQDGSNGTAPNYLYYFGLSHSNVAMAQVIEGYCTAPDVRPWLGPFSTVTFTIASANINWVAHPLVVGDRIFFSTSGTLPAGFSPLSPNQYYVVAVAADTFQVSATYGGTAIVAPNPLADSGTHTCWQLSASPYYITNSAQVAGVYVDSYRGVVNLWSKNGIAPKFLIGTSPSDSWEGNPNYGVEIGDRRLNLTLPKHSRLYGAWENGYAFQLATDGINRVTISSSANKNIDAYRPQWAFNVSGGTQAAATITLPSGMTSSYELEITFNGIITAIAWTATLNSSSPALPTYTSGWTVVKVRFMADNNEWTVLSVNGVRGWVALTDAATISTPAFATDQAGRFSVTLGGNRTLSNPTGSKDGQRYTWRLTQDATGNRVITWGNKLKFPGGAPLLSIAANAVDLVEGVYDATANIIYCQLTKAYA